LGPKWWQGQNWPCHHLGPEFRQLSAGKKHTVRVNFFEKKLFFAKKVTKLEHLMEMQDTGNKTKKLIRP
jgi:hypothetical protein